MARNATPAPEHKTADVPATAVMQEFEASNQLAVVERQRQELQASYGQDRDLLNQLLGQAQMADAFEQFSRTVRTSKLAYVRENKLYRALKGMQTVNGSLFSGTWDEFCQLLGTSRDKVELDIANLKAFGEEALESMSRMGIGYRELRQYRKLPDDQRQALLEAAKTGDKGEFLDLAEELIAKHAREKEALTQQVEEGKLEHAAVVKRLEVVTEQKEKAEARAARIAVMKPDEALAEVKTEATRITTDALGAIRGGVRQALLKLQELPEGSTQTAFAAGLIGELQAEISALREEFYLPDVSSASERELTAEVAQWAGAASA